MRASGFWTNTKNKAFEMKHAILKDVKGHATTGVELDIYRYGQRVLIDFTPEEARDLIRRIEERLKDGE